MNELYDVIIIGQGPAGMSAAIYAKRAELKALMIEMNYIGGGQVLNTYEVDNYPGLPKINGFDLASKFSEHVDQVSDVKFDRINSRVTGLDLVSEIKTVHTEAGDFTGKSVILATGNSPRKLGVPGETELAGMGVSYCATCDGAFFRNRVTVVAGGGDVAVEDAIFLARGCEKVYLVHRRDELRAAKTLQTALFATKNIEVIWNSVITKIEGQDAVTGVVIENVKTHETGTLPVSGVFVAVGNNPNTSYIEGLETDDKGYVVAGEDCRTSIPMVYAAGDVRTKQLRQIVTAVSDGANAVYSLQSDLLLG